MGSKVISEPFVIMKALSQSRDLGASFVEYYADVLATQMICRGQDGEAASEYYYRFIDVRHVCL